MFQPNANSARLPGELIDGLAEAFRKINHFAHASERAERRLAYSVKSALISAAITTLGADCIRLTYQLIRGDVFVLFALKGKQTRRTFHVPFEQLSAGARAVVISAIGTPAAFTRGLEN